MPLSSLDDLKKVLEGHAKLDEVLEYVTGSIQTEKARGIDESRKANKEAQNFRKFKTAVEKLGYDGEADLDEFIDTLNKTVEGQSTQSTTELSELQKNLVKLQKDFAQTQKELNVEKEQKTALQYQNKVKTIESKLLPKFQEEFYGANFMIKSLLADGAVDLDDTGEVVFRKGESVISLQDGMKSIMEQNADSRRNKQTGGAGSQQSNNGGAARSKFTLDQIKQMTPQQVADNIKEVNAAVKAASVN